MKDSINRLKENKREFNKLCDRWGKENFVMHIGFFFVEQLGDGECGHFGEDFEFEQDVFDKSYKQYSKLQYGFFEDTENIYADSLKQWKKAVGNKDFFEYVNNI